MDEFNLAIAVGETNAPGIQSSCLVLFSDLCADIVFLLIQGLLFLFGDVVAILGRHVTFFLANLAIFFVQPGCFGLGHIPLFDFVFDAIVLICQALIDLFTARMAFLKRGVILLRRRYRSLGEAAHGKDRQQRSKDQIFVHDRFPLLGRGQMCPRT